MNQQNAERAVKGLQKAFLSWLEVHPELEEVDYHVFNDFRRQVFRVTFEAFRFGVVGFDQVADGPRLWRDLFGWVEDHEATRGLPSDIVRNIASYNFVVTLQAFRIGSMVAGEKE